MSELTPAVQAAAKAMTFLVATSDREYLARDVIAAARPVIAAETLREAGRRLPPSAAVQLAAIADDIVKGADRAD